MFVLEPPLDARGEGGGGSRVGGDVVGPEAEIEGVDDEEVEGGRLFVGFVEVVKRSAVEDREECVFDSNE